MISPKEKEMLTLAFEEDEILYSKTDYLFGVRLCE